MKKSNLLSGKNEEFSDVEKPVDAREVSRLLNVSRQGLHRWAKQGIVPSHRVGGRLYYFISEVLLTIKNAKPKDSET